MAAVIVITIALGTLAFGAVYPWAFLPLFAVTALIGVAGLRHGSLSRELRPLALAVLVLFGAVAVQLLPMSQSTLNTLSPHAGPLVDSLTFTGGGSDWRPLSINPAATRIALIAFAALSLYLLGLPALLGGRRLRALPRDLAIFAVPLALFGIYARQHNNGLIYWFWWPRDGGGAGQFGPFVNRNHFAGWMLMAVCLFVGLLFGQVERAVPEHARHRQRWLGWLSSAEANTILLTGLAVLVAVIALVWTMSRSALLGFGVGTATFGWLVLRRRRLSWRRRAGVLGILGAVLLAGAIRRGLNQLVAWFQDNRDLLGRLDAWRDGWDLVRDFPLFGTGLNTYPTAMLFYQKHNLELYVAQAHNDYLQLLAEGGLVVTIAAAIAIVFLARAILRNLRTARSESRGYWIRAGAAVGLLAIAVQEIFEFSLQIPANAVLCCTLAGIALSRVHANSTHASDSRANIDRAGSSPDVSLP